MSRLLVCRIGIGLQGQIARVEISRVENYVLIQTPNLLFVRLMELNLALVSQHPIVEANPSHPNLSTLMRQYLNAESYLRSRDGTKEGNRDKRHKVILRSEALYRNSRVGKMLVQRVANVRVVYRGLMSAKIPLSPR
jgi:hypothetical protein